MENKMPNKKRKYAKRKNYQSRNKSSSKDMNLAVIGTIVFSALLAVLLYTNSGAIGQKLNEVLGGLMGILRYILPVGSFVLAIKIAYDDEDNYISKRLVQYAIILICIAIIMSVYKISTGAIETAGNMSPIIKKAYTLGTANEGGGAIGTVAAVFLVRMLGKLRSCCFKYRSIYNAIYFCMRNRYFWNNFKND